MKKYVISSIRHLKPRSEITGDNINNYYDTYERRQSIPREDLEDIAKMEHDLMDHSHNYHYNTDTGHMYRVHTDGNMSKLYQFQSDLLPPAKFMKEYKLDIVGREYDKIFNKENI